MHRENTHTHTHTHTHVHYKMKIVCTHNENYIFSMVYLSRFLMRLQHKSNITFILYEDNSVKMSTTKGP